MRAAVLALLFATAAAVAQEPPAVTAARQRQGTLRTVEFNVRMKSDQETATIRLVFDGVKARVEQHTTSPPTRTWDAATDGQRVRISLMWDDSATGGRTGTIGPVSDGVSRSIQFLPLTLAARSLDRIHCTLPLDTLTPAGTAEVNGRPCDEFSGLMNGVPVRVWFDPAAGHALRRFRQGSTVIDVESSNDNPAGVWLPKRYAYSRTALNGKVEAKEYTVENVEVGKEYQETEFNPPWPAGMKVHDLVAGEQFMSDADGVLHPFDDRSWWQRVVALWWVPVVLVTVAGGLIGWRRWRRRSRPLTPDPSPSRGEGS
jgi:hypothetical protein